MPVPNWLVKSLAWAFIAAMLAWVGYLQAEVDTQKKEEVKQEKTLSEHDIHFLYIKESLNRIETNLNSKMEK